MLTKFSFWKEGWAVSYNSITLEIFLIFPNFLSIKLFGNSHIPCLLLIITLPCTCEEKFLVKTSKNLKILWPGLQFTAPKISGSPDPVRYIKLLTFFGRGAEVFREKQVALNQVFYFHGLSLNVHSYLDLFRHWCSSAFEKHCW